MFSFFKPTSKQVNTATLQQMLEEILTPQLAQLGLNQTGKYTWHEHTVKEIRRGFSYSLLKGGSATLTWGVCLDFLPVIAGNKLVYYKPARQYCHHLFEWPEAYSNSFLKTQSVVGGTASHWGDKEARKSINDLFNNQLPVIKAWYNNAATVEALLTIAQKQVAMGIPYTLHHPSPDYVLAFLYARCQQPEKAIALFDGLHSSVFLNNEILKEKIRKQLFSLTGEANK